MARPTKDAEPGSQVTISLRVPAELKTRLEERAAHNHRNLSQEAERALERSFSPEAMFVDCMAMMEGPANRLKAAGEYVRDLARKTYGERVAEVGHKLMAVLVLMEFRAASGQPLAIEAGDLDLFRGVVKELERNCIIIEGDKHGQRTHQGARAGGVRGKDLRRA
jgi:predicted transcriptional regulator